VRDEWQYAYETYKGINIVLRLGDHPKVEANLPEQLRAFDTQDFRNDADYNERLATLKRQLAERVAPIGQFYEVPQKPHPFLNRPDELDELRNLVIPDVDKPTKIRQITVIEGMGGIGKSALATTFAWDRKVRFAFPDGIIRLEVGRTPRMYELYRAIGVALDDDQSNYRDETSARQNAQKALADKKCLLILDDVWEKKDGNAFRDLISGTASRLLITTRNLQIKNEMNTNEYRLKLIDMSQAADYLRSWVGNDPKLDEIAEKLGYLFLALKLAGALMKQNSLTGAEYLTVFERVSDMEISPEREDSLEISINLGVDAAFANHGDRKLLYHTFGIFQEDAAIPQQTILQLWSHLRPDIRPIDHLKTLTTLVNLGLVERHEDKTITLHNLLHSYAREKLGNRYVQTHQDLLATYRRTRQGNGWHTAYVDNYLYDHLVYHLVSAAELDEAYELFLSPSWMSVRFINSDYLYETYIKDIQGVAAAILNSEQNAEVKITHLLRLALIRTSLASISSNYPPEILGKLLRLNIWTSKRCISVLNRLTNHSHRATAATHILSTGKLGEIDSLTVQQIGMEAVEEERKYPRERVKLLKELMPYTSDEFRRKAVQLWLSTASEISSHYHRSAALVELVNWIDEDDIPQRTEFEIIAGKLPRGYWDFALLSQKVQSGEIDDPRVIPLLQQIILSIPEEDLEQSIILIFNGIQSKFMLHMMGGEAAAKLDILERVTESFDKTVGIRNDYQRHLIEELDKLSETDIDEIKRLTLLSTSIADEGETAKVLSQILPFLPEVDRTELFQVALTIVEKGTQRLQQLQNRTSLLSQNTFARAELIRYQTRADVDEFINGLIDGMKAFDYIFHEGNVFSSLMPLMSHAQTLKALEALVELVSSYEIPLFLTQAAYSLIQHLVELNVDQSEIEQAVQPILAFQSSIADEMKVHSNKPDEVRFFELLRAPLIMYLSPEDKEQTIDAVVTAQGV